MAKAPPSFDLYVADFVDGVRLMEADEVGAYILLMAEQWKSGSIPRTDEQRQRASQIYDPEQWKRVWSNIRHKFSEIDSHEIIDADKSIENARVLVNPRMHDDRENKLPAYKKRVEIAKKNGKKGGRPNRKKTQIGTQIGTEIGFSENPGPEGGRGKGEEYLKKGNENVNESELIDAWNKTPGTIPYRGMMLDGICRQNLVECITQSSSWVSDFYESLKRFPLNGYRDGLPMPFDSVVKLGTVRKILQGNYTVETLAERNARVAEQWLKDNS